MDAEQTRQELLEQMYASVERMHDCMLWEDLKSFFREQDLQTRLRAQFEELVDEHSQAVPQHEPQMEVQSTSSRAEGSDHAGAGRQEERDQATHNRFE